MMRRSVPHWSRGTDDIKGGRRANDIEPCIARICCCRDFCSRVPSGHVGTAACDRPDAALVSDRWRSTIWSATDHQPVLLGRRLGCRVWTRATEPAGIVPDVGAWIGTWHCGGIGRPVHRPTDQRFAGGWWLGGHGVCPLISDQRVLGNWRGPDFASGNETGPIETGLSVLRN